MYQEVLRVCVPQDHYPEDRDGAEWVTQCVNRGCPCNHPEEHRHLYINALTGWGYCFRCGKGISLERFISLAIGVPLSQAEYMVHGDRESSLYGDAPLNRRSLDRSSSHPPLIPAMRLPTHTDPALDHPYLRGRGVHNGLIEQHDLRICLDGPYKGRIITPVRLRGGKVVGYSGRATFESGWKTLYPKGFPKSKVVFNEGALTKKWAIQVEGELGDAFSVMRVTPHVFATFGNQLSFFQAMRVHQMGVRRVGVMLDGKEDPTKVCQMWVKCGFEVKVVPVPYSEDPGSMSPDQIRSALRGAVWYNRGEEL